MEESGRTATMEMWSDGEVVRIGYRSGWVAFPVEDLHAVQALCHDQRERFRQEALDIFLELNAQGA